MKLILFLFLNFKVFELANPWIKNYRSSIYTNKTNIKYFVIPEECIPEHPAIDDFPEDLFTNDQRIHGYIIIHILVSLYFFILLGVICDFYFVPSLQQICLWLNIESDVAGATLMAIGSSAPTLFIAIISVFFTSGAGEIGLGTIVGSTIFNTLFIISACGFAVTHALTLKPYPIIRDSIAYLASIVALVVAINDKIIHWYEAFVFVIIYLIYIIVMIYNKETEILCAKLFGFRSRTPEIVSLDHEKESNASSVESLTENMYISPFYVPRGGYEKFIWYTGWPLILIMSAILPKYLQTKLPVLFETARFTLSVILLGVLSYILVWMVCVIGFTFKIPDCVMGMTLLAAGSSIPDVMTSVSVSKKDQAAMGISNAIGSNVFDMLCLGVPWLIKTIMPNGENIKIESNSLIMSTTLLIGTMIYAVCCLYLNEWRIDKKIGFLFLISYLAIIGLTTVLELLACPCDLRF